MIEGPVAFRSNELRIRGNRYVLTSPSQTDFEWRSAVVWAKCDGGCPADEEGHIMPAMDHWCGIYATLAIHTLELHINGHLSVVALVEGLDSNLPKGGNIWLHESDPGESYYWHAGFRAPGAQIVYLVDVTSGGGKSFSEMTDRHTIDKHMMSMLSVAQQFHVDIITWKDALWIARHQWEKHREWHGERA